MQSFTAGDLQLWLLGHPRVTLDRTPVNGFVSSKVQGLLFYLAMSGRAHARTSLAGLFWPETPEANARTSLRKALANLNQILGPRLDSDRHSIALDVTTATWIDAAAFESQVQTAITAGDMAALAQALANYQGDFLEGFAVRDAAEFDTWTQARRDHFRTLAVRGLQTLATHHHRQGHLALGSTYARRLLQIEPWHEETHCLLMEQLARMGQRSSALAQFEVCRQILQDELGVEPAPETVVLVEQIRRAELGSSTPPVSLNGPASLQPPHAMAIRPLPVQPTAFVGREQELQAVIRRLRDPACRLLTLVGPGGIGKSRLALQAALILVEQGNAADLFADGVAFVELAPVRTVSGMISAIAEALGFTFYADVPPREQLLDFLREKRLMLILDNLEHLWAGTDLIAQCLRTAPGVKILATSRQALQLREAWFHPIEGLAFPPAGQGPHLEPGAPDALGTPGALEAYAAVRLFVQCVRRARVGFALDAERDHVIRICQLVEGMPLAIELAAAWWSVIPGAQIAAEIEQGLDLLTSRHQDLPARHRSIRAVFEHSWQLLTGQEQTLFVHLSVFHSGFDLEAAAAVAGASLPALALLVEKSLVRVVGDGRYQIHELLRQFGAEKLAETPARRVEVEAGHAAYYLDLLQARRQALHGPGQQRALVELRPELENIRTAWVWAARMGALDRLEETAGLLFDLYWLQSRYQEGLESFRFALAQLRSGVPAGTPADAPVLGLVEARTGAFHAALGHAREATRLLRQALATARQREARREIAFCLLHLSEVAEWHDHASRPGEILEESFAVSRAADDPELVADALYRLAESASYAGNFAKAKRLADASLATCRGIERKDWIAYALDKVGFAAWCVGEYAAAERAYREAYTLFAGLGDRLGMALALGGLGWTAWAQGEPQPREALTYLERSLALCREIGHRRHASSRLGMIGQVANGLGVHERAYRACEQGLALAREVRSPIFEALALNGMGDAARALGRLDEARQLLEAALALALDLGIQANHLESLVILGELMVQESAQLSKPDAAARRHEAMQLLTLAIDHPACWAIVRTRARRLCDRLEAEHLSAPAPSGSNGSGPLPEVIGRILASEWRA